MEIKELLAEGNQKKVYATNQTDQVIIEFQEGGKSRSTKKGALSKSSVNNEVSAFLFEYLESYNVPTHFVKSLDEKSFVAKKVETIPIVITVHNVASKDLEERFAIEAGTVLEFPVVEMYYKNEKGDLPMINEYHAYALGVCDRKEMTSILRIATKVNAVLKSFFDRKKLKLVHFNLEFGRAQNQIVLADEVSFNTLGLTAVNGDGGGKIKVDDEIDSSNYADFKSRIMGAGA